MTAAAKEKLVRPPKGERWLELFRYEDGEFIPDDGKPGLAFYGRRHDHFPFAFSYGTDRNYRDTPAHRAAMDACCARYGCANGRRVTKLGAWA